MSEARLALKFKTGDRVRYIGRAVCAAAPGERGTILESPEPNARRLGFYVRFDQARRLFMWASELEIAE